MAMRPYSPSRPLSRSPPRYARWARADAERCPCKPPFVAAIATRPLPFRLDRAHFAQRHLQHLAGVVLRKLGKEYISARTLEPSDAIDAVDVQRALECIAVIFRRHVASRNHARDNFFAPLIMPPSDHSHFGDVRVSQQRLLHLARIDIGAAADDQILGAVLECQEPRVIERTEIPGVHPAAG